MLPLRVLGLINNVISAIHISLVDNDNLLSRYGVNSKLEGSTIYLYQSCVYILSTFKGKKGESLIAKPYLLI